MVSNYIQLLEKSCAGKMDEDQQTYMRYANEGAKRMYKLIDSLLTFSRATIDTELRLVDLNDVLDDVERIVSSSSSKPVRIDRDDLPNILGDYSQMSQLFQNLVANAVKYNEADEIVIYVAYKPEDQAHRIEFHDNGIGIPEQYREQVFDIFKRLHSRDSYSGTGIGLSICKKIIHRLNGRIWVEDSLLGTGSAFVFTIPKKSNKA
jgi:light-regulated signal transduction histidine kinase (bacteriophytochrome)